MSFLELSKVVEKSINELYFSDSDLFEFDTFDELVSERCLTYRLGYYLQNNLQEYKVDSEYNRCLGDIKVLGGNNILPDLIIHKRKMHNDNLLWIEIKKKEEEIKNDVERLKKITSDDIYHYQYGLMLILKKDSYTCKYYSDGKEM